MSALPSKKHGGWADELKKVNSKKNLLENLEKERFLPSGSSDEVIIPEIDDVHNDVEDISEPPSKPLNKELNVDILKRDTMNKLDEDLSILIECLEPEEELNEPDEVWHWNQVFTSVSAQISEDK